MTITRAQLFVALAGFLIVLSSSAAWSAPAAAESRRMARAKDLIADEQWSQAIKELRAAAADPREPNKDEALFWLAHSQNHGGDLAEAVESIRRLQRDYPRSRWSEPAYSLLIELAQKLGRRDMLWRTAAPPAPPAPPAPAVVMPRVRAPRGSQPPLTFPAWNAAAIRLPRTYRFRHFVSTEGRKRRCLIGESRNR